MRRVYASLSIFAAACAICAGVDAMAEGKGYKGLFAPAPQEEQPAPAAPSGYRGLVPGVTQPAPVPKMTPMPGLSAEGSAPAKVYVGDANADGVPDYMQSAQRLPQKDLEALAGPSPRINDMSPAEYMSKSEIEKFITAARDPKLSDDERKVKEKEAVAGIESLARGLRAQAQVPASMYKQMGVPESYVKETNEGNARAIARLERALKELKEGAKK